MPHISRHYSLWHVEVILTCYGGGTSIFPVTEARTSHLLLFFCSLLLEELDMIDLHLFIIQKSSCRLKTIHPPKCRCLWKVTMNWKNYERFWNETSRSKWTPPGVKKCPFVLIINNRYTYDATTQTIDVIAPTFVHSACTRWFAKWGEELNDFHTSDDKEIEVLGNATLEKFFGDYKGSSTVPDAALYPQGRRMPTVVLEAGYTESYTQLLRDATLLLEGSGSRISYVILVKVSILKPNEKSVSRAFVELHTLDPISNTRIRVSRNVSFTQRSPCSSG